MSDRWTLSTGSEMTGLESSKLQQDLLSDYWSSYNHRASASWIEAVSDAATSESRRLWLVGLLGLNRRSPSALVSGLSYTGNTVRVRIDSYPLSSRIRPAFTLNNKVNLTGSDSALTSGPIDPPDDPAPSSYVETKLTPTSSGSATSLRALFSNHYATERALTGNIILRVHLRDVNTPTSIPNLTASIYQSGVLVSVSQTVSYERVAVSSSSGGYIVSIIFAAAGLTSQTAAIEAQLSTSTACDWIGLEMVLDLTGHLYDSGKVDLSAVEPAAVFAARPDLTLPTGVIYCHIEFSDFCTYTTASYSVVGGGSANALTYSSIVAPGDPDGRLHVGRFLAADALVFPIQSPGGYNLQTVSGTEPARTRSGSLRGARAAIEWVEADLSIIRISRILLQKIERLVRTLGIMRTPTLLVPDPGLTEGYVDEQTSPRWVVIGARSETHAGRMTGKDEDVDADGLNHTRDRWDVALRLIDHNGVRSGGL